MRNMKKYIDLVVYQWINKNGIAISLEMQPKDIMRTKTFRGFFLLFIHFFMGFVIVLDNLYWRTSIGPSCMKNTIFILDGFQMVLLHLLDNNRVSHTFYLLQMRAGMSAFVGKSASYFYSFNCVCDMYILDLQGSQVSNHIIHV